MTRNVRISNPTHRYDMAGESGPTDKPAVQWSYELDSYTQEIAVWDGQVYVTSRESISVFNTDGNPQWRFQVGSVSSPAVVDGTVYVGCGTAVHEAVETAVGTAVEFADFDGIYALDAASGTEQWRFQTDGSVSSPAVVEGTVYVASHSASGHVHALEATSGTEHWCFKPNAKGSVTSSPAVVDDTVYVGSYDGIYALEAASGTERWSFHNNQYTSSPTVVDGTVYVGSNGTVYALDAASGTERWSFQTDEPIDSSPAVVNGTVYVGSYGGIYALEAAFGDEQWSLQADESHWPMVTSPVVVNDTVYVGSTLGTVYALEAASETVQWAFQTDGPVRSSPVIKDGTIYVAGGNTVYALESSDTGSGETRLFERCSACHTDLNDYDDPALCPECGTDLSDSENETQIYDPD